MRRRKTIIDTTTATVREGDCLSEKKLTYGRRWGWRCAIGPHPVSCVPNTSRRRNRFLCGCAGPAGRRGRHRAGESATGQTTTSNCWRCCSNWWWTHRLGTIRWWATDCHPPSTAASPDRDGTRSRPMDAPWSAAICLLTHKSICCYCFASKYGDAPIWRTLHKRKVPLLSSMADLHRQMEGGPLFAQGGKHIQLVSLWQRNDCRCLLLTFPFGTCIAVPCRLDSARYIELIFTPFDANDKAEERERNLMARKLSPAPGTDTPRLVW